MQNKPKFDPQKHHRKSIRLKGYDYSQAGAYFVTIVTDQRDCLFGEIVNEKMTLNQFGKIVDEYWCAIPEHFSFVELSAYVVMPNHLHGIIVITDNVGATQWVAPTKPRGPKKGSLGAVIGAFKMAVTRKIQIEYNATGIWQRNYYEHIIRNEKELENIYKYIENNPIQWANDDENPSKVLQ